MFNMALVCKHAHIRLGMAMSNMHVSRLDNNSCILLGIRPTTVYVYIIILRSGTLLFYFGLLKHQWLALINFGVDIFSNFFSYI